MAVFTSSSATLNLDIRNTWSTGMIVDVSLTPVQSVDGWTVTFDYSGDIGNIWNARVLSRVGDRYIVEALGYNANIAAGGTVSFGFQGRGSVHEVTPAALIG